MSTISVIRSIVQDIGVPIIETNVIADLIVQLQNYPVKLESVIITQLETDQTLPDYTINYETGTITYASVTPSTPLNIAYVYVLLSDDTITDIIELQDPETLNLRLAAADVLEVIATNQALVLKRIKSLDLDLDGPAVSKALREHAKSLRDIVEAEISGIDESDIEIAEMIYDVNGLQEFNYKKMLRES